jgi:hypothetical protein
MAHNVKFTLRFPPTEIPEWALQYDAAGDDDALAAGRRIANDAFDPRNDLAIIFEWKTRNRGKSRLLENTPKEISDAFNLAVRAKTDRSAVAVLTGLSGVGTPVASAILTAVAPERYTIIDFRALGALNYKGPYSSLSFYLHYLRYCRGTAQKHRVSLRTLDRALWQWSFVNQPDDP